MVVYGTDEIGLIAWTVPVCRCTVSLAALEPNPQGMLEYEVRKKRFHAHSHPSLQKVSVHQDMLTTRG